MPALAGIFILMSFNKPTPLILYNSDKKSPNYKAGAAFKLLTN